MGNTIPVQIRSVDPYSSYNSDIVNKLTRIITDGNNVLLSGSPIDVTQLSPSSITVTEGKCVIQDVLLEIQDFAVDLTDPDFYIDSSSGTWNETGYYLVVMQYEYQKTSPPPSAYIRVIMPSQKATLYDPSIHLFLKCIEVNNVSGFAITTLHDLDIDNPSINRPDSMAGSGGAGGSNVVITDGNTTGLGAALYSQGTGAIDRWDEIWVKTLHVENIDNSSPPSPPGSGVYGTSTYGSGTYGDLAEMYSSDPERILEVGSVVSLSDGEYQVEQCNEELSIHTMGIVSSEPAYLLNSHLKEGTQVGLVGRIPVKIVGPIKKKDIIVSCGDGCARAATDPSEYVFKIGISLENNNNNDVKLVDCFIK